jgi:hypothetical protein
MIALIYFGDLKSVAPAGAPREENILPHVPGTRFARVPPRGACRLCPAGAFGEIFTVTVLEETILLHLYAFSYTNPTALQNKF